MNCQKILCAQKMPNWPKNEFYNNLVSLGAGSRMDTQQFFEIMIGPFKGHVQYMASQWKKLRCLLYNNSKIFKREAFWKSKLFTWKKLSNFNFWFEFAVKNAFFWYVIQLHMSKSAILRSWREILSKDQTTLKVLLDS